MEMHIPAYIVAMDKGNLMHPSMWLATRAAGCRIPYGGAANYGC